MAKEANASLDALEPGALEQQLPGITEAMDRDAMARHIEKHLIGAGDSRQVQRCSLVSAILLEDCAVLRYEVEVEGTGGPSTALITGRVFSDSAAAENYARERVVPLTEQVRGRAELASLTSPVAVVQGIGTTLYAYPIDGELPTLGPATDGDIAGTALEQLLGANGHQDVEVQSCRAEPVHYNRRHRCMLRYRIDLSGGRSLAVYGKVTSDDSGARIPGVVDALLDTFERAEVALPQCLGWRPDLKLVAFTEIPGAPRVAQLLKARLKGESAPGETGLEDAVDMCGRIAAALHTSGLELGEARPLEVELARLRGNLAHMTTLSPQLARRLGNWLNLVEERAASTPVLDLCQCHGDFSYTQLIFDGPHAGLVDFDNFCRAEPALDLGQFLAYLHYAGLKARVGSLGTERAGVTEDLARRFADSYLASGGRLEALRRVPIYEATNLIRMAEHAWQNLKSRRLEQLVTLLGERMAA
jgi:hypothetical protein